MKFLIAAVAALSVSGCAALPVIGAVAATATGTYCFVTTEEAREAARAALTGGQKVLACGETQ